MVKREPKDGPFTKEITEIVLFQSFTNKAQNLF